MLIFATEEPYFQAFFVKYVTTWVDASQGCALLEWFPAETDAVRSIVFLGRLAASRFWTIRALCGAQESHSAVDFPRHHVQIEFHSVSSSAGEMIHVEQFIVVAAEHLILQLNVLGSIAGELLAQHLVLVLPVRSTVGIPVIVAYAKEALNESNVLLEVDTDNDADC